MNQPKIFVGTLEAGESEFEECCQVISRQRNVEITHHIISHLPELDAHNQLWKKWEDVKKGYDLFVKVDADTILIDKLALHRIWKLFEGDRRVTGAQILLHDYFTDNLIPGLNSFTPKVKFQSTQNHLMPDRSDTNHDVVLNGKEVQYLAPIGWHCKYPSPKQSFHFGLHRALKKQDDILKKICNLWVKSGYPDDSRSWAITGYMAASFWMRNSFDYNNKKFEKKFLEWEKTLNRTEKIKEFVNMNFII